MNLEPDARKVLPDPGSCSCSQRMNFVNTQVAGTQILFIYLFIFFFFFFFFFFLFFFMYFSRLGVESEL